MFISRLLIGNLSLWNLKVCVNIIAPNEDQPDNIVGSLIPNTLDKKSLSNGICSLVWVIVQYKLINFLNITINASNSLLTNIKLISTILEDKTSHICLTFWVIDIDECVGFVKTSKN
eukprot:NODE_176_length_15869_cov_0.275777.p11 type:complete len:117 gc:universal NODE_176_length_15869_cov_0.275777:4053-3703(-)